MKMKVLAIACFFCFQSTVFSGEFFTFLNDFNAHSLCASKPYAIKFQRESALITQAGIQYSENKLSWSPDINSSGSIQTPTDGEICFLWEQVPAELAGKSIYLRVYNYDNNSDKEITDPLTVGSNCQSTMSTCSSDTGDETVEKEEDSKCGSGAILAFFPLAFLFVRSKMRKA